MRYTIGVLLATMVAGQPADNKITPAPAQAVTVASPCFGSDSCCGCESGGPLARLLCRVRSRLCHRQGCSSQPCCEVVSAPVAPAPPVKEAEIKPVAARSSYAPRDIAPEYLTKVGRADDFGWIIGQLFYVHADGGLWVVRYAPLDREDRYGGSVVLAPATNMDGFHEGDLVLVHGKILNEGRASKFLGGPPYRADAVNLNQRLPK